MSAVANRKSPIVWMERLKKRGWKEKRFDTRIVVDGNEIEISDA